MKPKKTVCFVGHNKNTVRIISRNLEYYLGDYIDVKTWYLNNGDSMGITDSDIYITSCAAVRDKIKSFIDPSKKVIVADRAFNIKFIDKVLEIPPRTKVLMVGSTEETAMRGINMVKKIGIDYLKLTPYYPGITAPIPSDIKVAFATGSTHLVPAWIDKVIDLGVVLLDLSTYNELILELDLPKKLINKISHKYSEEIFRLSIRRQKIAELNENLKRRLEVTINTVSEAIIAVDSHDNITFINTMAENLLEIKGFVEGDKLSDFFKKEEMYFNFEADKAVVNEIREVNDSHYVFNANPLFDEKGNKDGAVISFKPVGEVQKIDTKVRRVLKKRGTIAKHSFKDIIGQSDELRKAINLAYQFSQNELTVLIEGESGTGKELFAQAIHNASSRKSDPFVAINFAALTENLVESELFGYEEGAFTGAKKTGKAGFFEEAHQGTIFLDEIGDCNLNIQKKLLRVLEEREIRRVGGNTVTPIDVRIIAATNKNLYEMVEQGTFRSDLFYRLCTLPLQVPSLQERKKDILVLFEYFSQEMYNKTVAMDKDVAEFLRKYHWPGNVRELHNIVQYIFSILAMSEDTVKKEHLPEYLKKRGYMQRDKSRQIDGADYEELLEQLKNMEILREIYCILIELKKQLLLQKGIGRNQLKQKLEDMGCNCPEHKLRKHLELLHRLGFVENGKTRQGTKITDIGIKFYKYLEEELDESDRVFSASY